MATSNEADGVRVHVDGELARVTLCSPGNRNAQTPATWRRLAEIGRTMPGDVRVVLVDAEGPSFCAGLDRRMFAPEGIPGEGSLLSLAADATRLEEFISGVQGAFTWWRASPAITIGLVQGHAVGAGFQLALACDLVVAAEDAQFAMRETSYGIVPDLAGTWPLVRTVGYSRALEICSSGRFVPASEALALGLVQWVVDDLPGKGGEIAQQLLQTPADALTALKPLLLGATDASPGEQAARERAAQTALLTSLAALVAGA